MNKTIFYFLALLMFATTSCGDGKTGADESKEDVVEEVGFPSEEDIFSLPANARVFFANVKHNDVLSSPVKIEFGLEGMMIEPAGEPKIGYGHHHLFINREFWPEKEVIPNDPVEDPIPNDAVYTIHYGQGQTESEVNLSPGKYTLTLQFADGFHRSYGDQMAESISVEVK